jgi:WD40 repeat protein
LKGNVAPINAVSFSPDGEWLAGAGRDGNITLWNIAEGAIRHTLSGHVGEVESVAFSPDGARLASSGGQEGKTGEVKVWEVDSGKALWSSSLKDRAAYNVAWLSDGATLVTAAYGDGEGVQLWDATNGKVKRTLSAAETRRPVWSVAVSPDGTLIAAVGTDGLRLWDANAARLVWKSAPEYNGFPTSIQFAPDGKTLVTCGFDGRLQIWAFGAFGVLRPAATLLTLAVDAPAAIAFTPEGFYVAAPEAASAVRFRVGNELLPSEQFKTRFNRPDALQAALSGAPPPAQRAQ